MHLHQHEISRTSWVTKVSVPINIIIIIFVRPLTSQIASDMTSFCILLILPSAYSLTPSCEINGVDHRGRGGALDTPFLDNLLPM